MYITIFNEFIDDSIFKDLDIEVKKSTTPCKPASTVAKHNIKLWYQEDDNVEQIIDQLIQRGCTMVDRNPYLTICNKQKVERKIYYNDRIIMEYKTIV